jgi:hypothetical protein
VFDCADWTHRGDYIGKRNLTPTMANQALADPNRLVINPDPASNSGRSVRIIGYSITAQALLTVIVLEDRGTTHGVNAWRANDRDQRNYREGEH